MWVSRRILAGTGTALVLGLALGPSPIRADAGDIENSHDYPGFARQPGFVISDFDEDNPADFTFPIAQPLTDDADHVVPMPVKGHRFVIRYEPGAGSRAQSIYQTQQYYERLASDGGYTVEKGGAVGDVTETFYKATPSHQIWVYLEPAVISNVLTIIESTNGALPALPPRLVVNTAALPPAPTPPPPLSATVAPPLAPPPEPALVPVPEATTPSPVTSPTAALPPSPPAPEESPTATPLPSPDADSLFTDLNASGRVVVPFIFRPGKDQLDDSSLPLVGRVAAMMKNHPDLFLRIEGHTDNSGRPDDNLRLSAQRALAVEARLVEAEINKKRLDAVGVGGLQPIASNTTAEGREKNRRIELVLWKKYPAFHSPAPNGNNYYPGGAPPPTRAGL